MPTSLHCLTLSAYSKRFSDKTLQIFRFLSGMGIELNKAFEECFWKSVQIYPSFQNLGETLFFMLYAPQKTFLTVKSLMK